jgi:hypothetical protein
LLSLDPSIPLAESLRRRSGVEVRGDLIGTVPYIVVDDHRWMLPAMWAANRTTSEPAAPALVLLDQHAELSSWDATSDAHMELQAATRVDGILEASISLRP